MSWLDDDSIYSIFNKPNHRGPGTHFDEDKAHVSSKPIPASGGAEKEDILMTDFMPSAATVKKESDELFAEVGNQGGHAGNTAADESDEDDEAPARPAGRGGKRGGAGRKADPPEVKAAKAAARAETKTEAKVIEAAKLAAIKANLTATVETPAASVGGGAAAAAPAQRPPRSTAPSRRGSIEDVETLGATAQPYAGKVKATFQSFNLPEDTTKTIMDLELSKRANTIEMLKPRAAALGIDFPASITKKDLVLKILERIYG